MLKSTDSISFWRDEDIVDLECPFNFIVPKGANPRGDWPGSIPSLTTIIKELSLSRVSYLRIRKNREGKTFIHLLAGRLIVNGHIVEKERDKKFFLSKRNGVEYATNRNRGLFIATGKRVKHRGIYCSESFMDEGSYTQQVLDSKHINIIYEDESEVVQEVDLSYEESELLNTLDQYIDSEFEIEQQTAQATPPFSYFNLKPEARNVVYRQFYRIDVNPDDLSRMREMKVSLVTIETSNEEGLAAEIVDLSPVQGKDEIIISLEKQVPANAIPKSGLIRLNALPTLKNVRGAVVEQLRQKKCVNQWLVPVAAGNYNYRQLSTRKISIPQREFPPNPSQIDALDRGAGTDDYLLVLGPPGTGKTTVILDWVRHFVGQGKRVLITSQSNMAVDNVLERLVEEDDLQCIRLGNETKVTSSIKKILIDNFATNIQNSLIDKISETKNQLAESAKELQIFQEKLPRIKSLKEERHRLDKEQAAQLNQIANFKKQLEDTLGNFAKQSGKLEKLDVLRQKREKIFQSRSQATGFFSFISKMLSRFDASRLTRLEQGIVQTKELIGQHEAEKLQTEKSLNEQRLALEQNKEKIGHVEHSFRKFVEASEPLIPELSVIPHNGLTEFNEKLVIKEVANRTNQYKKLQDIVGEWQKVFSGERQKSIYQLLLSMVDVVGATCIGINTNRSFKDIPFDVVIVDESGQIQLHNLIVPLSRGPKAILVGDHKQLPPVVQDEIKQELSARNVDDTLLSKSWFEILWEQAPSDRKTMMDTQFRCPSSISDFVSKAFYEGKYKAGSNTGPDKKKAIFSFFKMPMVFIDTSNFPEPKRREKSTLQEGRTVVDGNHLETSLILEVLEKALSERPELGLSNEIGIIAPYANHVKEIQRAIRRDKSERFKNIKAPINELIASVDSFQGQERDLIIMAFTRSNRYGSIGFLCDWRRLNVAMTRTKKQLVLIGDLSTLKNLNKSQGRQAIDWEFKNAIVTLENFIKIHGHFIDASNWSKISQSRQGLERVESSGNMTEGVSAHV